jgi:hypothetical protein
MIELQVEKCGGVSTPAFRTLSYVPEIIRTFLQMQGIQRYLQRALSMTLLAMLQDPKLFGPGETDLLVHYTSLFADGLVNSIGSIPSLVRYFFRRAFLLGGLEFLQILFYDLLLKPALMNPKLFAVLPETGVCPATGRVFLDLTRIVWWAIKPDQLNEPRFESFRKIKDLPDFRDCQIGKLFDALSVYDGAIEGVSLAKLQDVTGVRYHLLLMSVNDVVFLTDIINSTLEKLTDETAQAVDQLKALVNFQIPAENDEVVDFWFQEFRSPIVPSDVKFAGDASAKSEIVLPLLERIAKLEQRPVATVVGHFLNYLQGLKLDSSAPADLHGFLAHQKAKAEQTHSTEWLTRTQSIAEQIGQLGIAEEELLSEVTFAVAKGLNQSRASLANSFAHQECYDELVALAKTCALLNTQLHPILHQVVLAQFVAPDAKIAAVQEFQTNDDRYLT